MTINQYNGLKASYTGFNHTIQKRTKADIKYIVVHYVGATGGAKANCEYYASTNVAASADFYVGHDGEVWQLYDIYKGYSWHTPAKNQYNGVSGGGKLLGTVRNANSVGVELCVRTKGSKDATSRDWYFEKATVDAAVELVKHLMKELDIDADHVVRHFDVTSKICPNPFVLNQQAWKDFKSRLTGTSVSSAKIEEAKSYSAEGKGGKVFKVTASVLNVRSGAGTKFDVIGQVQSGQKCIWYGYYTDGWYLVSLPYGGTGWVSKSYLKAV